MTEQEKAILLDVLEHVERGGGLVVHPEVARKTPCRCFEYEGETYCWSPGVIGLISGKKEPHLIEEFCKIRVPADPGLKHRFLTFTQAVKEAKKEYEKEGGGVGKWWEKLGEAFEKRGITP